MDWEHAKAEVLRNDAISNADTLATPMPWGGIPSSDPNSTGYSLITPTTPASWNEYLIQELDKQTPPWWAQRGGTSYTPK